jgi:hypothetical protein
MTDATRPKTARGKIALSTGVLVAALFAVLALAPLASATPDPLASGTTTVTLSKSVAKSLKKAGVKISATKPAKLKGTKASFTVTGGELDPTTGAGVVTHSGGLKVKAGSKSATISALEVNTAKKALSGKVGGKKVKIASLAGVSFTRNGFGVNLAAKKLKLTGAAASALNKALAPKAKKGAPKPAPLFKGNTVIGSATSETQPSTVTVLPGGNVTFTGDTTLFGKLADAKVQPQPLAGTTLSGTTFTGPILGGTVSPAGTAGVVQSGLGLNLVQNLPTSATTSISTTITLGGVYVDLAGKTATVEVAAVSNAESEGKKPLNLGNLGRSSVADITVAGVSANPTTRTVTVSSAGVLQPVSAEVLNGFIKVYAGYAEAVTFQEAKLKGATDAEAAAAGKAASAAVIAKDTIKSGEALGAFSFTAQAQ